jgi:hypothetical protein
MHLTRQKRELPLLYSVHRLQPTKKIGPARTIDHALLMAESAGAGRYEVSIIGDLPTHVCFLTNHEDGTFTIDPRQAGSFTAVLNDTLTRA